MTEPVIVPRAEHPISRRDIDSDALKVLYRLHESGASAYLVGGSVRDLLLGRRPKDFDIGTSAHPYQVKKLFRNCWIIGRRFRLAHVRFGLKTIEVATFRKIIPAGTEAEPAAAPSRADEPRRDRPAADAAAIRSADQARQHLRHAGRGRVPPRLHDQRAVLRHRRLLDHRLRRRPAGPEGRADPLHRRSERAVPGRSGAHAARHRHGVATRLPHRSSRSSTAIATHRQPDRPRRRRRGMIEEYYKILRSGYAEQTFRALAEHRLLEPVTPEIQRGAKNAALWESLAALDAYRRKFESAPATLRNPILLGTLLIPLGLMPKQASGDGFEPGRSSRHRETRTPATVDRADRRKSKFRRPPKEPILKIGMLPIARGDTERLRQMLSLQARIADLEMSPRAKRALMHRGPFEDALTWFEIHGNAPAVLEHWKGFIEALGDEAKHPPAPNRATPRQPMARRRRRRRRGRRRRGRRPPNQAAWAAARPHRPPRRRSVYPFFFSNSCMNATSASTPSSGNAL